MSLDRELLARCLAAVRGRVYDPASGAITIPVIAAPTALTTHATVKPVEPPLPLVRPKYTSPMPAAPAWASCEEVLGDRVLGPTAKKVFTVLHGLAVSKGRYEGYPVAPDSVVQHIPAQLVALGCGIGRTTLYRVLPQLVDAGVLAYGAQAQKVGDMGLYSGVLWCVKTRATETVPRLTRANWKTEHRDFAADIDAGRTVKALVEEMEHLQGQKKTDGYRQALQSWPMHFKRPLAPVDDVAVPSKVGSLLDVAYRLGDLVHAHPAKLQEAITETALALALALHDPDSKAWYAGLLHAGLAGERGGRGSLGVLAAQLTRVHHDVQDWQDLKNPAALLASRLKSAS